MSGIENLRNLLREDTALTRTELLKHPGEIRMIPHSNEKHRFYIAEGNWDLLGRDRLWTEGASMVTGVFGWLRGLQCTETAILALPFRYFLTDASAA
jgi:hypothetical protein